MRLLIVMAILVSACQSKLNPAQLKDYIQDESNGLVVNVEDSVFSYKATYQPPQMLALIQKQAFPNDSSSSIAALTKEFSELFQVEFELGFKESGVKVTEFISTNSQYVMFGVQEDFKLVSTNNSNDTLNCTIFNLEQSSYLKNTIKYQLGFPRPKNGDYVLLYQGRLSQGTSRVFHFSESDINSIPQLVEP